MNQTPVLAALRDLPSEGCVLWTGALGPDGYAYSNGISFHRYIYELVVGPIPAGLVIDHLCHTRDASCGGGRTCLHRRCVNPSHMEPVSAAENGRRQVKARQTNCVNGHAFDAKNTYIRPDGTRDCRACTCERQRRYKARRVA